MVAEEKSGYVKSCVLVQTTFLPSLVKIFHRFGHLSCEKQTKNGQNCPFFQLSRLIAWPPGGGFQKSCNSSFWFDQNSIPAKFRWKIPKNKKRFVQKTAEFRLPRRCLYSILLRPNYPEKGNHLRWLIKFQKKIGQKDIFRTIDCYIECFKSQKKHVPQFKVLLTT